MARKKRRTGLGRLFRIKKKDTDIKKIDPSVLRKGADADRFALSIDESRKLSKQRRPFLARLIRSFRRKPAKSTTPLILTPIEPEPVRKKYKLSNRQYLIINSTIKYLVAYILIYLIYQLTVVIVANLYGLSGVLYFHKVFWPIGDNSRLWFPYYKIIVIMGSGPFISLLLGLLFLRIAQTRTMDQGTKLFFLWLALHGLNMFFGAFVAGVTTNEGFGYVALWLYMSLMLRIVFSFIFLFALAAIGYYSTGLFYETAQSQAYLKSENKRLFILYQTLLPSILGAIIMLIIRIPENPPYQVLLLFTLLFATFAAYFNKKAKPKRIRNFPKHNGRRIEWGYIIVLVALLLIFRWLLYYGLHIILRFSVSLNLFGAP
ncbi:MAG: hypothetical protein WBJ84_06385 [Bacteroidales bacterium]